MVDLPPALREIRRLCEPQLIEVGGALLAIDGDCESPFPSSSGNRLLDPGVAEPSSPAALAAALDRYRDAGARRCFAYLSPCAQAEAIADWLLALGFTRYDGPAYLTLASPLTGARPAASELVIRPLAPDDPAHDAMADIQDFPGANQLWRTLRRCPQATTFGAFDAEAGLVAGAALVIEGPLAYLAMAATAPAHRGRGAQSALIAARLASAAERGCTLAASETLSLLTTSLANLQRAGFDVAYERLVYAIELGPR